MVQDPLVSVIVPCYNAERYLGLLCKSIQDQSLPNFEVLILDDGSSDGSFAEAERFAATDPRFQVARTTQNRGVALATAELLRRARGEFWVNPGADDLVDPDFLARRLGAFQGHPKAALVHGSARLIDSEGNRAGGEPSRLQTLVHLQPLMQGARLTELLLEHNVISTPSIMARMSTTGRVLAAFNVPWQFAQDWYLWLLLALTDTEFVYDARESHSYRMHPDSLTHAPEKRIRRETEIRLAPLVALSAGRKLSPLAARMWAKWRVPLYALWLARAARLKWQGQLDPEMARLAARAYYGSGRGDLPFWADLARNAANVGLAAWRDYRARRGLCFPVAGLAEIRDPAIT